VLLLQVKKQVLLLVKVLNVQEMLGLGLSPRQAHFPDYAGMQSKHVAPRVPPYPAAMIITLPTMHVIMMGSKRGEEIIANGAFRKYC